MYNEFDNDKNYVSTIHRKINWCLHCNENLGAYVKCPNCNDTGRMNENTLCDCNNGLYWESEICQQCDL